jgi:hypothetical protein
MTNSKKPRTEWKHEEIFMKDKLVPLEAVKKEIRRWLIDYWDIDNDAIKELLSRISKLGEKT